MDIVALDDPTRVLPPGEIGEIRIRGANVMSGYRNRPQETAAVFVGDWAIGQLWLFWVAPIVGALIAGFFYRAVLEGDGR
jgi:acyl-CoA synthetase (AMP-forming)/AMP-acid ligase II